MVLSNQEPSPALAVSDLIHYLNLSFVQLVVIFHAQTVLSKGFHLGSLVGSCADL